MDTQELIPVAIVSSQYGVELSFIRSLHEFGLIEITTVNETAYILKDQLTEAERLIRLHQDLQINIEGIDAVSNLLIKIKEMQHEIISLKNRIRFYESYDL